MRPQQLVRAASSLSARETPVNPVLTSSYRDAHQQLCRMFAETRPLALLAADSRSGPSYLVDHFLASAADSVSVVRLSEPFSDEDSCMSAVIRGVGFDPTDLSLADLENVLTLFLSFQKKHHRRTILCLEEIQEYGIWLIDMVHRIIEREADDNHGLFVLLSGRPIAEESLNESLLEAIGERPEQYVHIANFSLAETREYLRWRVESSGTAKIADVFEFDAITLVHEITGGNVDEVGALGFKCLQLASRAGSVPVTVGLVNAANSRFESEQVALPEVEEIDALIEDQVKPPGGTLIVRLSAKNIQEYSLQDGHVLIGRGKLCDVRIASPSVSRHHALVISAPNGPMLVDLESTNGTQIDGHKIKEHPLLSRGVITMGDCNIDFVPDDDKGRWLMDVHGASRSNPYDAALETQEVETWPETDSENDSEPLDGQAIKGNINRKGEKIYHVPGTSKYNATKIDESKGERWFQSEKEAIAAGWRAPRIG